MEKMNFSELEEFEKLKSRYNIDKEELKKRGYDKNYIYHRLAEMYPDHLVFLHNDEDFQELGANTMPSPKFSPRKQSVHFTRSMKNLLRRTKRAPPLCIDTDKSICMPGTFARYNIGDYDELNNFVDIYHLMFQTINTPITPEGSPRTEGSPKTPEGPPPPLRIPDVILLGIFLIIVEDNGDEITISFVKTDWDNDLDKDGSKLLNIHHFEKLMENSLEFKNYIQTYITKIVQDKFVFDRDKTMDTQDFYVLLDFYYNRSLKQGDVFHQDHDNFIKVDYFTLTYILSEDKVVLGASLLVEAGKEFDRKRQLNPAEYASLNVAVKNLTTLGLTNKNKTYHSTPAPISCRKFRTQKGDCYIPSKYNQHRIGSLEVSEENPITFSYDNVEEMNIDLVPLELEPLPYHAMKPISKVITNTETTRRSFLRCWYITMKGRPIAFSKFYSFNILKKDIDKLYDEALSIDVITLDTFFHYVLGGKHKTRKPKVQENERRLKTKIIPLRKIFYNPNKNIILIS